DALPISSSRTMWPLQRPHSLFASDSCNSSRSFASPFGAYFTVQGHDVETVCLPAAHRVAMGMDGRVALPGAVTKGFSNVFHSGSGNSEHVQPVWQGFDLCLLQCLVNDLDPGRADNRLLVQLLNGFQLASGIAGHDPSKPVGQHHPFPPVRDEDPAAVIEREVVPEPSGLIQQGDEFRWEAAGS